MGETRAARHVVVIGLMAAGKSTLGEALARRLGRRFYDNDRQVADLAGAPAAKILDRHGRDALHDIETAALHEALDSEAPAVITAAAATVLDERARARLQDEALVVWVRAAPAVLAERAAAGDPRPGLEGDESDVAQLARMAAERASLFREVADVVVDTDRTPVDEAVTSIAAGLSRPG